MIHSQLVQYHDHLKMSTLISIRHKITNAILFEHECENNTIKTTVEIAVKKEANLEKADLWMANLRGANLWMANLRGADLRMANLGGANLLMANLRMANLRMADLRGANLWEANLGGANLREANLWRADLWRADLQGADLREANLGGADLRGADLREADLRGANLRGANLREADLWRADLWGADLREADLNIKIPPLFGRAFISEILWREAKTEKQKDFASRILRENRCWEYFYKLAQLKEVSDWAEKVLNQWEIYQQKIERMKNDTRIQHNEL